MWRLTILVCIVGAGILICSYGGDRLPGRLNPKILDFTTRVGAMLTLIGPFALIAGGAYLGRSHRGVSEAICLGALLLAALALIDYLTPFPTEGTRFHNDISVTIRVLGGLCCLAYPLSLTLLVTGFANRES
jgi:hypothetical protein